MDPIALFVAAVVLLPAVGLMAWAWLSMEQDEADLLAFSAFEGRHFDA